jgi:hypothetical protein
MCHLEHFVQVCTATLWVCEEKLTTRKRTCSLRSYEVEKLITRSLLSVKEQEKQHSDEIYRNSCSERNNITTFNIMVLNMIILYYVTYIYIWYILYYYVNIILLQHHISNLSRCFWSFHGFLIYCPKRPSLYGAETWTLRTVDQKHLESFEMWCWRTMEKISWTDHVRN